MRGSLIGVDACGFGAVWVGRDGDVDLMGGKGLESWILLVS